MYSFILCMHFSFKNFNYLHEKSKISLMNAHETCCSISLTNSIRFEIFNMDKIESCSLCF